MRIARILIVSCLVCASNILFAQDTTEHNSLVQAGTANVTVEADAHDSHSSHDGGEFDPTEVIMHHIKDAHSWHFFDRISKATGEECAVELPLPIILITDGHLDIFLSSAFEGGKTVVNKNGREYIMHHEPIYLAESGKLTHDAEGNITNAKPIDLSITKNVASMMVSAVLLLLIFVGTARGYKKEGAVPTGLRGFTEPLILFVKDDIAVPNLGEEHYKKYLPYLLTLFFFIWINNMLGLFPVGANLTGNIAVTFVLAFLTLLITNFSGTKHYWKDIINTTGVPWWLQPIMTIVEFVGIISKPFALMIRLFANITAGHIIVLSLVSLIFIFQTIAMAPVSILFVLFMDVLELLVAALQAYIFTMLTALFIGLAIKEEE